MIEFTAMEKHVSLLLLWLWNNSSAELGEKSSWETLTSGNSHNNKSFQDPYHFGVLKAICKKRQIENALLELTNNQRHILYANFGPVIKFPLAITHAFSKEHAINLTATVLAISEDYTQTLLPICLKKMNKQASMEEQTYLTKRAQQALQIYKETIQTIYPLLRKVRE